MTEPCQINNLHNVMYCCRFCPWTKVFFRNTCPLFGTVHWKNAYSMGVYKMWKWSLPVLKVFTQNKTKKVIKKMPAIEEMFISLFQMWKQLMQLTQDIMRCLFDVDSNPYKSCECLPSNLMSTDYEYKAFIDFTGKVLGKCSLGGISLNGSKSVSSWSHNSISNLIDDFLSFSC